MRAARVDPTAVLTGQVKAMPLNRAPGPAFPVLRHRDRPQADRAAS